MNDDGRTLLWVSQSTKSKLASGTDCLNSRRCILPHFKDGGVLSASFYCSKAAKPMQRVKMVIEPLTFRNNFFGQKAVSTISDLDLSFCNTKISQRS